MHLLVTDRLACARCGPSFGLVLVADRMEERQLLRGFLGCANCRDRYPVEDGFGDLRPAPRPELPVQAWEPVNDPEGSLKLAALLGVREGPGLVLLTGDAVRHARRMANLIERIEIVAAHPALRNEAEMAGVSRIACGGRLPFFTGSLRGVVLQGRSGSDWLDEGVRVLAPQARLVFLDPPPGVLEGLENGGLDLLMEADSVLVGARK